jgi:hypothetical protein
MAALKALLQIQADVQGERKVTALGGALAGVGRTATAVTGNLRGLTAAAGMSGLAGSMTALAPLLSIGGLVSMSKNALDAGKSMYILSQRTGVSVESLARFKKAASTTGTDIDAVAKAAAKLSKGLYEAGETGKGTTAEALTDLGISARDSAGQLRSADEVMLDIATRFQAMPDGVEKTALAIKLFGRAGADMIPMLNMGGDAIESMQVKMTEAFAKKATEYSAKLTTLSGKVGALGMDIMVALLPALDSLATMLTVVVSAFNALPEPLRNLVVLASVLAVAWGPITGLLTALAGLKIGATIAGWAGVIGPAIAAITAAFSGLLAYLTGTMLPALLAFFSGPAGWTVLAVAAVVAMAIAFREPIGEFLSWLGGALQDGLKAGLKIAYDIWVKPWVDIWDNVLRKPISDLLSWMGNAIRAPFEAAANFVKGIIRGILQTIANGINAAVGAINRLIGAYNSLPTPDLPLVPTIAIPQFAQGGVVNRPTLAMVGEGGEREYIIPESKMAAASARYLSGGRGDAVLSGGAGNAIINIRTGPVMSAQGQQWVTMADLERAVRQTEAGVMARIRTPAGRRALGIR